MAKRRRTHPNSQAALAAREEEAQKRRRQKEIEALRNTSLFGKSEPTKPRKPKKEKEPSSTVLASKNYRRAGVEHVESFRPGRVPQQASPIRYDDEEMRERERLAQKEIKRKKMRVAPMYNKGGYQYVTDETDPSDLGRKK